MPVRMPGRMPGRRPRLLGCATAVLVAAGGLVAVGAGAVSAPATATYACTFPDLDEVDVPLTVQVTNLPRRLNAGIPVAAGAWDVRATLQLDDLTTAFLLSRTDEIVATLPGLAPALDEQSVALDLGSGVEELPLAEPLDVALTGTNRRFVPRSVGRDLPLELPDTFTLSLADGVGAPIFAVGCEWWDGDLGVIGTLSVDKQTTTMTRTLVKKPVRPGKRAKVLVTVRTQAGAAASGEVRIAQGRRQLATGKLDDGRVVLRLPRLPAGKHRVTVTFTGSRVLARTARNLTVKVVEKPSRLPRIE